MLLVDDEEFARISFKSLINWNDLEVEIIGEASNGKEALEIIKKNEPDIIFLDIKMPQVNGIEVLEELNKRDVQSKVIVLSSYNEFEYVKQAMKLGAIDYLHKPTVNDSAVLAVIIEAKKLIEEDNKKNIKYKNLKRKIEEDRSKLKPLFLKELIEDKMYFDWEIERKFKTLDICIRDINIYIFNITINNLEKVKKRYDDKNKYLLDFAVKNIIYELLQREDEVEFFQYNENIYTIIKTYSNIRSLKLINEKNEIICMKIKRALKKFLNINITISISNLHNGIIKIPKAFKEAFNANEYKFFSNNNSIIYYNSIEKWIKVSKKNNVNYIKNITKEVVKHIDNDDFIKANKIIKDFLIKVDKERNLSIKSIRKICIDIYYILYEKYIQMLKQKHIEELEGLSVQKIMVLETINDIINLFEQIINRIQEINTENKVMKIGNTKIKKLISYINENYQKELQLEDLADYINLNSSYLSRLFKKEMGCSLFKYINKCRIDAAEYYLKNTNLKHYEIADMVGYKNVEYFNSTFKKMVGISPTEYKSNFI